MTDIGNQRATDVTQRTLSIPERDVFVSTFVCGYLGINGGARGWPGVATATPRRISATPLATPSTTSERLKVLTAVEKCGTFLAPLVHCRTL